MSAGSQKRSAEFLQISGQFKLGALVTESSHPVTANLSDVASQDIAAALKLLFDVDDDVVKKYREFVESGRAGEIKETVLRSLEGRRADFLHRLRCDGPLEHFAGFHLARFLAAKKIPHPSFGHPLPSDGRGTG